MRVEFSTLSVIVTKSESHPLALRSSDPLIVDGKSIEPSANGLSTVRLNADQSAALRELQGDPKAAAEVIANGALTLPDGKRGRKATTGDDIASFFGVDAEDSES